MGGVAVILRCLRWLLGIRDLTHAEMVEALCEALRADPLPPPRKLSPCDRWRHQIHRVSRWRKSA